MNQVKPSNMWTGMWTLQRWFIYLFIFLSRQVFYTDCSILPIYLLKNMSHQFYGAKVTWHSVEFFIYETNHLTFLCILKKKKQKGKVGFSLWIVRVKIPRFFSFIVNLPIYLLKNMSRQFFGAVHINTMWPDALQDFFLETNHLAFLCILKTEGQSGIFTVIVENPRLFSFIVN
jgi:hypothetical protein